MKLYKENNHYGYISLGLGIISSILWLIPVAGLITSVACLIFVYLAFDTNNQTPAVFGLVLGILGLVLVFVRSGLVLLLT